MSDPSYSDYTPATDSETNSTSDRIVTAARKHFFTHGFRNVTMDDLADELGMSKKTLYSCFPTKAALLEAVLLDKSRSIEADLDRIMSAPSSDVPAALQALLACIRRHMEEIQPAFVRDMRREAPEVFKVVEDRRRSLIHRYFGKLFNEGRRAGIIRKDIPAGMLIEILLAATDAVNLPDAIAVRIADIFSSEVDFHRDLRRGDRFSVVYEMHYDQGEPVRPGRVLAAEFVNQGSAHQAVWFQPDGGHGGYYTLDGKNIRRAFLRSPLEFSRITSRFTNSRFHPILGQWRAHRGIDYAAPVGTRVRATGNGVVEFVGYRGAYGNLVVIRHHSSYTTWYAHLSRFAPGVRRGARVSQGDVQGAIAAGQGSQDFLARSLIYGLEHREKSLSNALVRAAGLELVRFNRGISVLDTCITVAPLLGLLGTVTGMMGSFGMLGGGELSAPAQITGGIAEALIATAFGLGIAVTALLPMNYLHSQSEKARHEMEDVSTHLELLMKPVLEAEAAARERRIRALMQAPAEADPIRPDAAGALEPRTAVGFGAAGTI